TTTTHANPIFAATGAPNGVGIEGIHSSTTGTGPGLRGVTYSTSGGATAILGLVASTSPGSFSTAVSGINNSTTNTGIGILGTHAGSGFGMYGSSVTGTGVYGIHTAQTGGSPGVHGATSSTADDATGVLGVVNSTNALNGSAGVRGVHNGNSGAGAGVYGSHSYAGMGVYGHSVAGWGVLGRSESGKGVSGYSPNGAGVEGSSDSDSTATGGVVGRTQGPAPAILGWGYPLEGGLAGSFQGSVEVTGTCCAADASTLRIDDPRNPAGATLDHAAVASNEQLNLYNGTVVLDAAGTATVALPAWFTSLNTSFRYQLTAVGAPGPNLYIAQKIGADGRFGIAGGAPGGEVSWQVTGVRHDPYAVAHPVTVEQPKTGAAAGTYRHPELYGQPDSARYPQRPVEVQPAP
ncbi:MAG TPA: hypothetical protein VM536_17025, partial [Chloroflexia bacterium]|nr:hypothetical protein [Chloroflexia bacterium]